MISNHPPTTSSPLLGAFFAPVHAYLRESGDIQGAVIIIAFVAVLAALIVLIYILAVGESKRNGK